MVVIEQQAPDFVNVVEVYFGNLGAISTGNLQLTDEPIYIWGCPINCLLKLMEIKILHRRAKVWQTFSRPPGSQPASEPASHTYEAQLVILE